MTVDGSKLILRYRFRTGNVVLSVKEIIRDEQVFTFQAPGRAPLHFHIKTITDLIAEGKPPFDVIDEREVLLRPEDVAHVEKYNGIEENGLSRAADFFETAGYIADFGETQVIIDGNHRLVARARAGRRYMQFVWLTRAQWRMCLLDVPADLGVLLANLPT
jgi:hypothetical protein